MTIFPNSEDAERRTVDEAHILDLLLLRGWPIEIHQGAGVEAEKGAHAALSGLIALGLPFQLTQNGQRKFDPVELSNFLIWAGRNLGDATFAQRYVRSAQRLICAVHGLGDDAGSAPSPLSLGGGRYRVTLQRRFNLTGHEPGQRIRLRLPVPLEDRALTGLQVEFLSPSGMIVETRINAGHMHILAQVPPNREISVGIRASFTAWPQPLSSPTGPLSADERELYLRPVEGLIRITERIQALADRLAGQARDTQIILRRFWDYILNEFTSGSIHYDRISPTAPLDILFEQGLFDCRLGSALMIALCRARGIPARMVSGYMLNIAVPAFHSWLEVWTQSRGWYPVDLYGWGLTTEPSQASGWRDHYYGQIDHRMVVERPPRIFGGSGDVRLPPRWHMLNFAQGKGATTEFREMYSGELVYAEHIEIERLDGQTISDQG